LVRIVGQCLLWRAGGLPIWSKDFLEAGKKRLAGDTAWAATSDEVKELLREASAIKESWRISLWRTACSKKHERDWGRRHVRYPAPEKA
jgi:hypothetical protein